MNKDNLSILMPDVDIPLMTTQILKLKWEYIENTIKNHMMNLRADCCNIEDYHIVEAPHLRTTCVEWKGKKLFSFKIKFYLKDIPMENRR